MAIGLTVFESGFKDESGNIIMRADLQNMVLSLDGRNLSKEELERKIDESVGINRQGYYVPKGDSGFYIVYRRRK